MNEIAEDCQASQLLANLVLEMDWERLTEEEVTVIIAAGGDAKQRVAKAKKEKAPKSKSTSGGTELGTAGGTIDCPECKKPLRIGYPRAVLSDKVKALMGSSVSVTGFCESCGNLVRAIAHVEEVSVA